MYNHTSYVPKIYLIHYLTLKKTKYKRADIFRDADHSQGYTRPETVIFYMGNLRLVRLQYIPYAMRRI